MKTITGEKFDRERALYGSDGLVLRHCSFDGPADGESALKESRNVRAEDCFFNLRYPFWHDEHMKIVGSEMTELCRAALWYSKNIEMENSTVESEYFMMRSDFLTFRGVTLKGKYSFQYIENSVFENCNFDTKDAFWHAKNVVVRDSVVKGEYLAWYSNGLTLINCKIIGTQPFCYCRNLKLAGCEMIDTDLAFEKSEVEAVITTKVNSIKNPRSGKIRVPEIGELIMDDADARGEVLVCELPKVGGFCKMCNCA